MAADVELIPNGWGRTPKENELIDNIADIDVLVSGTEPVTGRVLAAAPNLKLIAKHGVGFENIDIDAAKARGVPVVIAGGAISDSVADMALALLLACARHIPQGNQAVRDRKWPRMVGTELRNKTLGIVGLGTIGREVAKRAWAFGMDIVAYDVLHNEQFVQDYGVRYVALHELLNRSDFITLHVPVTGESRHLINAVTLALMKPTTYLINTARGELVDEVALAKALREKRIAGAACDVFQKEPPGDNELFMLDNFIAAPHNAGQTHDGLRKLGEVTVDNVIRLMKGEELLYRIA